MSTYLYDAFDYLNIRFYHIMYGFKSECTLYSCLNVKESWAWYRLDIWSLNDCNGTGTLNRLVCKRTLKHLSKLAKWLSFVVSTYLCDCTTVSWVDSFPTDTSLRTDARLTSMGIFPTGQFPDWTIPPWRLPRPNISPLRPFPDRIISRS